jgi:hypothetical protein
MIFSSPVPLDSLRAMPAYGAATRSIWRAKPIARSK